LFIAAQRVFVYTSPVKKVAETASSRIRTAGDGNNRRWADAHFFFADRFVVLIIVVWLSGGGLSLPHSENALAVAGFN
jgi:hypothetical protein